MPKLKQHLLPRIIAELQEKQPLNGDAQHEQLGHNAASVLFKQDRIFEHNIMRINYTTYDVRRAQDVLHTSSSQCNIMVLNPDNSNQNQRSSHPFRYARALGVYHANVIYVGQGMVDYQPRRMEFLWVRWYRTTGSNSGWEDETLDRVQFLPMADDNAFDFIDPSDVLRGCHIVPRFSNGRTHLDGKGLSRCARDTSDFLQYYVNR